MTAVFLVGIVGPSVALASDVHAIDDSFTAAKNVQLVVDAPGVLANDINVAYAQSQLSQPINGFVTNFMGDGSFIYTPAHDFVGVDSFIYSPCVNPPSCGAERATVRITVVGSGPVAVADSVTVAENSSANAIDALANDSDPNGDALALNVVNDPLHGTISYGEGSPTISYTPTADYVGSDSFTYSVIAGGEVSGLATVSVTVSAVNHAPVAVADSYTTPESTTLTVGDVTGVLANDSDAEDDAFTAAVDAQPQHGDLTMDPSGTFVYIPNTNYNGTDTFTYHATDGTAGNTVTVTIVVTPVNTAPVAIDKAVSTNEDVAVVIDLGAAVSDSETLDANLTYNIASGVGHGSLTTWGKNPTYTPDANWSGTDSFSFYVIDRGDPDGCGTPIALVCAAPESSLIKTVTITVGALNDAPVAVADAYNATEDTTLTVGTGTGVLVNDTDVELNSLTAVLVANASHGVVTLAANGSFGYVPAANYNGSDTFTYKANDGTADGNTVTVTITISAVNDAPVAVNDSPTVVEDTTTSLFVLANDSDVDLDTIQIQSVGPASHGAANVALGGLSIRYVPDSNYFGADSFDYTITDGHGLTSTATITLNVSAVNDAPVCFIVDTTVGVAEDGSLPLSFSCTDVESTPIVYGIGTAPTHGSITSLNTSLGTFNYTPSLNYNGFDSFTITGSDGVATSAPITVTVSISAVNDAPLAVADSYTTAEEQTLIVPTNLGVLANDSDVESNPMTASVVTNPFNGILTLNPNGSFTYVPSHDINGPDSFSYRANDGTADGNTVFVSITVTPINDAPTAIDGTASTSEDTAVEIDLGSSSDDAETVSANRTYTIVTGPGHGTLTGTTNIRTYTPELNYAGSDTFTFNVTDLGDPQSCGTPIVLVCTAPLTSTTQTITITIGAVDDAPVAVADAKTLAEDASTEGNVLTNDTDVESATLTATRLTNVSNGVLVFNEDGSYGYTPTANYNGTDSFTYQVNDGHSDSSVVTVTFTITPVNDAPVIADDSTTTQEDSPVDIGLATTASDVETGNDNLTYTIVTEPANGVLTGSGASRTYTPDQDFNGPDTFTFSVTDRGDRDGCGEPVDLGCTVALTSEIRTITITVDAVNDAPVAVDDVFTTNEDTTLTVSGETGNVLDNDADVDHDTLTAILVSNVSNGTLVLDADGTFTYVPDHDFNGTDSFTYQASDGTQILTINGFDTNDSDTSLSNVVTVTITVTAVNDAPVASSDSYTIAEDTTLDVTGEDGTILTNDSDVDHDSLSAVLVTGIGHGTLVLDPDGTFTFAPNPNFNGTESFTYRASDGTETENAGSNIVTVTITILPINDAPTATDGTASTAEDVPVAIDLVNLVEDDETGNTDLVYTIVDGPAKGELTGHGPDWTYTPTANLSGSDSFTYSVTDRGDPDACGEPVEMVCTAALTSTTQTIAITVSAVNDAPVALADAYTTAEDATLAVDNGESGNVLDNDTDVEHDVLTAVIVTNVSDGTLTLLPGGTFWYTPRHDFNGTDSFTYRANDGTATETALGNIVTVTITVTPVNDAVIAVADEMTVIEDTATTLDVLANDIDVDLDTLHVQFVGSATHGTAYIPVGELTVRYIPDADYFGADSFNYTATDGHGTASTTTVSVDVTAVNDAPVAVADGYLTAEDTTLTVNTGDGVLVNDHDVDSNTLHAILVVDNSHGVLDLADDGSFTYTPTTDFTGAATFTYKASDGTETDTNTGNIVTVTIAVGGTNDAPVAVADAYTTAEDTTVTGNVLTNDTDLDLDTLNAVLIDGVSNGSLTLHEDGSFSYTPALNVSGTDSFTYKANDGDVSSNTVTVSLTINAVNDAPVAVADSFAIDEDSSLTGTVLANDTDVEGSVLHVLSVGAASNGAAFIPAGGLAVRYIPDANFNGVDSFDYTISDGHGGTSSATVTVNVTAINDLPVCAIDDVTVSIAEDGSLPLAILCTDVDAETTLSYDIEAAPSHGSVVDWNHETGSFTYQPAPNYNGPDSFSVVGSDDVASAAPITVTVTITAVNDAPVSVADAYTTNEDTTLDVSGEAGNVLDNDSDVEIDAAGEGDGDVTGLTAVLVSTVIDGTLALHPDGTFSYMPDHNFNGTDSFSYQAFDGTDTDSAYGNIVTVTITVTPVNDAPVALADAYTTAEDATLAVDHGESGNVLDNDTDVENNDLTAVLVTDVNDGTLVLDADGTFTYAPDHDFNGIDSFTYRANDGTVAGNTVTVTITITSVNDGPVAVDDIGTLAEGAAMHSFDVLVNDTDADHDTLLLTTASVSPASGIVSVTDGQIDFTPGHLFSGNAAITYTISDGHGVATGMLNVAVAEDVVAPVISSLNVTLGGGTIIVMAPITVSWAAIDAGVGVASYDVEVSKDGGAFTAVYTGPATTWTVQLAPSHDYEFRVRATDEASNVSAFVTVGRRNPIFTQSRATSLLYRPGVWTYVNPINGSADGYRYSSLKGASVSYTFTGREIVWVAPTNRLSGLAYVYIDGVKAATINLYAASGLSGQQAFKKIFSASGRHTIKIVVAVSAKRVSVDTFLVLR